MFESMSQWKERTRYDHSLLTLLLLLPCVLHVTSTAVPGINKLEIPSSCSAQRCGVIHSKWPVRVALRLSNDVKDSFSVLVRAHDDDLANLRFEFIDSDKLEGSSQRIVQVTDALEGNSLVPSFHLLRTETWMVVTISLEKPQHLALTIQQQGPRDGSYISSETTIRAHLTKETNRDDSIEVLLTCSLGVLVDVSCLNAKHEPHSLSSLEETGNNDDVIPSPSTSGSSSFVPSPHVIWTVSVCGVLLLLVGTLFTMWHCQRKKLIQRRHSHQHQILKRQQLDHQQQRQFMDNRQSDIESFRELDPDSHHVDSRYQDKSTHHQNTAAFSSLKPRTYVRPPRKDRRFSDESNTTITTVVEDPSGVHMEFGRTSRGGSGDSFDQPQMTSAGSSLSSDGSSSPSAEVPIHVGRLRDNGGITGPYWFHSSRKPDHNTALKIFKV